MWESCWSAARFYLHLTDQQFGALTPRQLDILLSRHRETVELNKTLFGIVAAAVANFGGRDVKRYLTPADFIGGEEHKRAPRVSKQQQIANIRAFLFRKAGKRA